MSFATIRGEGASSVPARHVFLDEVVATRESVARYVSVASRHVLLFQLKSCFRNYIENSPNPYLLPLLVSQKEVKQ